MRVLIFSFSLIILFFAGVTSSQNECKNKVMVGELQIHTQKKPETIFVAQAGGNHGGVLVNHSAVTISHKMRTYYAKECPTDWKYDMYRHFKVLGGWLSFTADVSKLDCSCNGAIYLSHMPGYDEDGKPFPTKGGDYWCEANCVRGQFCPEMDLMEANKHAMAITPHQCDKPINKHYPSCDREGCHRNLYKEIGPTVFGPSEDFVINSLNPFSMNYSFHTDNKDNLIKIITVMTGHTGRKFTIEHNDTVCGEGYLESMTQPLRDGMALVAGNWGEDSMGWLDSPPCSGKEQCNYGDWTFWDFQVYETETELKTNAKEPK